MSQFLRAAESILNEWGKTMSVRVIVQKAIDEGILVTKGKTPDNTMRARLSEHIREHGKDSLFIRVGPNEFGLREWNLSEYDEHPFVKLYDAELLPVICIKQELVDSIGRFFGYSFNFEPYLNEFAKDENLVYQDRTIAEKNNDLKQLISYVLLRDRQGNVLAYRR